MKKILCLVISVFFALGLSITAFASPSRVNDTGDFLTDAEEQKLSESLQTLYDTYGIDVVILLEDTYVSDIPSYTENYYFNGGYGENGILFYLSTYERDWHIRCFGSCMETVTDNAMGDFFSEMQPYLAEDDFYTAMETFVSQCDNHFYIVNYELTAFDIVIFICIFELVVICIAFIVALIVVFAEKRKMKTAVLQSDANEYVIKGKTEFTETTEIRVNSTVTRVPIPQNNGGGGRSGGGGSVRSTGRGGKF